MVYISYETPIRTALRLHSVMRASTLAIYEDAYAFHECPLTDYPSALNPTALAHVRDDHRWSQLEPATAGDTEAFFVWRFHFPEGADNSGFVGWLASHLKSKFGAGVFVICGQNSDAGGIYDYWGAPLPLASDVITELSELTGKAEPGQDNIPDLNGVLMQVVQNSPSSVINRDTVFLFEQRGDIVRAQYEGGHIVSGTLDGILQGDVLEFCFSQIETPSNLATGTSKCCLRRKNGHLELVEDFTWSDEDRPSGQNIFRQI